MSGITTMSVYKTIQNRCVITHIPLMLECHDKAVRLTIHRGGEIIGDYMNLHAGTRKEFIFNYPMNISADPNITFTYEEIDFKEIDAMLAEREKGE